MRYSDNYNLKLPQRGVDRANVDDLDDNFEIIDGALADDRQIGLLMYDSTATYNTGAIRGYENPTTHRVRAYRCLEDNVTGPWDATKWAQTTLAAEIENGGGGGGSSTLAGLSDVDLDTPADGEVLTYDATEGKWVNADPISGASELSDLDDVTLTTPTEGQILTFDGDEWVNTDAPDVDVTKTATGNPIEITDGANAPLVKCVTEIQGSQDLHGYDKPWVGGAGKNKLPLVLADIKSANTSGTWSGNAYTSNGVTFTIQTDNGGNVTGIVLNGTSTGGTTFNLFNSFAVPFSGEYKFIGISSFGSGRAALTCDFSDSSQVNVYNTTITENKSSNLTHSHIYIWGNNTFSNLTIYPMAMLASETDPTFAPYSNICPITAYTEGEIEVSDGDGNTTTHTTTYPSAIFRGSEDVVGGRVTSEWITADPTTDGTMSYNGTSAYSAHYIWRTSNPKKNGKTNFISNAFGVIDGDEENKIVGRDNSDIIEFLLPLSIGNNLMAAKAYIASYGTVVAYELATPSTSSVTPTNLPIKSLSSYSHIESSTGDMEIEYIVGKYQPIVDLIQSSSGGDSQHHYSTTEQVVGTWIDGSTLYEKTVVIDMTNESVTDGKTFDTGIQDADFIVIVEQYFWDGKSGTGSARYASTPLFYRQTSSADLSFVVPLDNKSKVRAVVRDTFGADAGRKIYIVLHYTKTSQSRSAENLSKGEIEEKKVEEPLEEKKEELSEPISEPLETKTDNLSKEETELKEEDESKEIEEITEEPTEEEPEEPVDPEPSKEEADER